MPCYRPLHGYIAPGKTASGKRNIVFSPVQGFSDRRVDVPCGSCEGCMLERSRQWSVRIMHEAATVLDSCFVTLTYDDAHLPEHSSLDHRDVQLFFKSLRKKGFNIRYFIAGEYGDAGFRPHYHVCLFGLGETMRDDRGVVLLTSDLLTDLWGRGIVHVGALTPESAAYVARYCFKKLSDGGDPRDKYSFYDETSGKWLSRKPEYCAMSRRPGIGSAWLARFGPEVYAEGSVIVKGKEVKPPRYYDEQFKKVDEVAVDRVARARAARAYALRKDNTPDRLLVKQKVLKGRLSQYKRGYENV